jgi:hypothetical protein
VALATDSARRWCCRSWRGLMLVMFAVRVFAAFASLRYRRGDVVLRCEFIEFPDEDAWGCQQYGGGSLRCRRIDLHLLQELRFLRVGGDHRIGCQPVFEMRVRLEIFE